MPSTSAPSTPKPAGKGAPVAQHGRPRDGMECMATMDDISESNYCEYLSMPSGTWLPSQFAADTVEHLLDTQFAKYLGDVEKAAKDCAAAVRRLVSKGPPVYIEDKNAMPLKEGDTHIAKLWFMSSGEERSAKLKGALDGAERDKLWGSQKETLAAMEAAETNGA